MAVRIICDCAELAVECLEGARALGFEVATEVDRDPLALVCGAQSQGQLLGLALTAAPSLEALVGLAHWVWQPDHADEHRASRLALAIVEPSTEVARLRKVALDLGITSVAEIAPLLAVLRLLELDAEHPWAATARNLPDVDRMRLRFAQLPGARSGDHLVLARAGCVAFSPAADRARSFELGAARDVAHALEALRDTERSDAREASSVDDIDARVVLDVLFGPHRALSDPASKAALAPYGIPVPEAELCASASRAASEANRIGFPVRLSLASPDLRVWDHPDLAVDMVDNSARVRDTFRLLMGLARTHLVQSGRGEPAAWDRVLGVMVTATSEAVALLGVRARPLPHGSVALELSFADSHGAAADDRTLLVMPAAREGVLRALKRLTGHGLLLRGPTAQKRAYVDAIADVLLRVYAFVNDRRVEVSSLELRPLSVLLDGSVEVREACVTVSDAFERTLSNELSRAAQHKP